MDLATPLHLQAVLPCSLCAKIDHMSRDCPNESCFKCGGTGHRARVRVGVGVGVGACGWNVARPR